MAERTRGYAHRVNVNAPVEMIWRVLTEVEFLAVWCGPGARVSARANGGFFIRLNGELEREAHIDVFEPKRRLRLIYLTPPELQDSEAVIIDDFILDTEQGVGVVRLLGSGFPPEEAWDPLFQRLRAGWGLALARLKVCAEQLAAGKDLSRMPPKGPKQNS